MPFITEPIIPEQKSRNITIKRYATQAKSSTHLSRTPAMTRGESLDPKKQAANGDHFSSIGHLGKLRAKNAHR